MSDSYYNDLTEWEESFFCNECGNDEINRFTFDRTPASSEVWICECGTETIVSERPNEDDPRAGEN